MGPPGEHLSKHGGDTPHCGLQGSNRGKKKNELSAETQSSEGAPKKLSKKSNSAEKKKKKRGRERTDGSPLNLSRTQKEKGFSPLGRQSKKKPAECGKGEHPCRLGLKSNRLTFIFGRGTAKWSIEPEEKVGQG